MTIVQETFVKYFKPFFILAIFLLPSFFAVSFAATYPASCPEEAQAVVSAMGGCSEVDPTQYSAIYGKCCTNEPAVSDETVTPETPVTSESTAESGTFSTYYIQPVAANVRKCMSLSCEVIGTFDQNTELEISGYAYDRFPDWVEIGFQDGSGGYISKTVLSKKKAIPSSPSPTIEPTTSPEIVIEDAPRTSSTAKERPVPTILLIIGTVLTGVAVWTFVMELVFRALLFVVKKYPTRFPRVMEQSQMARASRILGNMRKVAKKSLIWGIIALVIGLSTR